jgi:ATP-dependent Clp protease ATP-binding subunit ClpA
MAQKFTAEMSRILAFSGYEASQWGSVNVEPHHVLLALLREAKPLFRLWSLDGADAVRSLRVEIESLYPLQVWTWRETLPLSAAAVRLFDYAAEEARHMGALHVGAGHLLLALLREEYAPSTREPVLRGRGLDIQDVRQKISAAR